MQNQRERMMGFRRRESGRGGECLLCNSGKKNKKTQQEKLQSGKEDVLSAVTLVSDAEAAEASKQCSAAFRKVLKTNPFPPKITDAISPLPDTLLALQKGGKV